MRVLLLVLAMVGATQAQEHFHPPQHASIHESFYSNWMRPDQPMVSCCNLMDCYPTEVSFVGVSVYAKRREDGQWIYVPPAKIEKNRDSPDGRNHVCMPSPLISPEGIIYCFIFGSGG